MEETNIFEKNGEHSLHKSKTSGNGKRHFDSLQGSSHAYHSDDVLTSPRHKQPTRSQVSDDKNTENSAYERALKVQAYLGDKFATFIKTLYPSNIDDGFYMGLRKDFCHSHMPKLDANIVLENESGECYNITYLAERLTFSAGWRNFSKANNLVVGDVLVFQLVQPFKFKVYVIKSNGHDSVVDGALNLMHLHTSSKKMKLCDKSEGFANQ